MLTINQLLHNRYRIVRQLGHGGMGAVYEAIDERFGAPIALKEIIIEGVDESQRDIILRAFEREAKSLAKIRHESVPFVRDYFSELGHQFLVMELVEGDDLAGQLAKRHSPFPVGDVLNWMDQLLDTLDYLHSLDPPIIHRDIKPQNLKLTSRQKIKLLDFGIIKNTDAASAQSNQTFMGATLGYSPIEQMLRVIEPTYREFILLKYKDEAEEILAQNTDVRSDIYSLGATFYHILTGKQPVDSPKRALELWLGHIDPLENPSALNPDIPLTISACLLKAMELDRDNRFSSAAEMQEALQNAWMDKILMLNAGDARSEVLTREAKVPWKFKTGSLHTTIAFSTNEQKAVKPAVSKPESKSIFANRIFRAAPIAALILVAVAFAAWITVNQKTSAEAPNEPAENTATITQPVVIPTVEPAAAPTATPEIVPGFVSDQSIENINSNQSIENIGNTAKTPVSLPKNKAAKPVLTKKPVHAEPKPKAADDPNCIFTNSCK